MIYPRSEILFPHRCVSLLKRVRGPEWQDLVSRIADLADTDKDSLAFALMKSSSPRNSYAFRRSSR